MPEHARLAPEAPIEIAEDQPAPGTVAQQVYKAINLVMTDMAKAGVAKSQRNTQQNFQYRGVDDVMDALAPSLARHQLIVIPHVLSREVIERESRSGGKLFHTILNISYELISAADGSRHGVGPIYGEAMDSGDKATNKAMAAAYKYACTQTFCIPFSGDDPDAHTHEVAGAQEESARRGTEVPQSRPSGTTSTAAAAAATPARPIPEIPTGGDGKPRILRPGGNFGYGKKCAETPWNCMHLRDLEWFLQAERTPEMVRQKIAAELAWRDYDTAQLNAARDQQRRVDMEAANDTDIPFSPAERRG
jgi:hypothetical protein